ncbi:hypothetical protein AURDEDRAFT_163335 [Auricularia subglabra TFB-10046 SS5]|nr:hypothetical protein AURDEDRAFT_163335 [Auricularia subglabra TFB-10046 SS5]
MTRTYRPRVPPATPYLDVAARDVINTLQHDNVCGPQAVVFLIGSFACKIYCDELPPYSEGYRSPNDVDILTCTPLPQEEVKRRLAAQNESIRLIPSRTPGMTYKVVRYAPAVPDVSVAGEGCGKLIKVDTLIAGESLSIPAIPANRVRYISGWPVPPLSMLLLLRLQGWSDHRRAFLEHHRHKAQIDVSDLASHLIPLALRSTFEGGGTLWEEASRYLPDDFMTASLARTATFTFEHPWTLGDWHKLGVPLGTPEPERPPASLFSPRTPMEHQHQQHQQPHHAQQPSGHPSMAHQEPAEQKQEDPAYVQHGKDFASGYAKEMGKQTAEEQYDALKDKMNEVPEDSIWRKIFPCFFGSTPTPPTQQGQQA